MDWTLAIDRALPRPVRLVLKGIAEVFYMDNAVTGIFFLAGFFVSNWISGVAALVGTFCSTYTAVILQLPEEAIDMGLFGFNGTLVGVGLLLFLKPSPMLWLYVVVASIAATIVHAALMNILGKWNVPASTAPFISITWIFLLAVYSFSQLTRGQALPIQQLPNLSGTAVHMTLTLGTVGTLKGVAEVMFQDSIYAGILFLLGIAVASWRAALFALGGAIIGIVVPWFLGVNQHLIVMGLYSFNPVLTLMAVGAVYLKPSLRTTLLAIFAGIVTVPVQGAIANFLTPLGLPTLTSPYVATMWMFVFAVSVSKLWSGTTED